MVRAAVGQICRPTTRIGRQTRQTSSKRLIQASSQNAGGGFSSNLSSIAENCSALGDVSSMMNVTSGVGNNDESMMTRKAGAANSASSPTSKQHHLVLSTQLKCATDSIDL